MRLALFALGAVASMLPSRVYAVIPERFDFPLDFHMEEAPDHGVGRYGAMPTPSRKRRKLKKWKVRS